MFGPHKQVRIHSVIFAALIHRNYTNKLAQFAHFYSKNIQLWPSVGCSQGGNNEGQNSYLSLKISNQLKIMIDSEIEDMPSWNVPRVECNKKQQLLKRSKIFEYSAFRFLTSRRKFNKKQQWSTQKLPWPGSYGVVLGSHAATNHVHSQVTNFWLTSYNPELGELLARSPICWVACIREEYGKVEGWEAEGTENSVKDKDSGW